MELQGNAQSESNPLEAEHFDSSSKIVFSKNSPPAKEGQGEVLIFIQLS
jgi:hypothetical protein